MNTIPSKACLTGELLRKMGQGDLDAQDLSTVEEHLEHCERCREFLDSTAMDEQWRDQLLPVLRKPGDQPFPLGDLDENLKEEASLDSVLRILGPTDDPDKLGRIGPYEVMGVIGRGGMGVVFKALDPALNRFVAIKMLLPHLAESGAARKRFAREGQAAAAVIDDHVMPIFTVAEWQGIPYLVSPYSRGVTLQKRIQDQGHMELREILRIGMQTARGLAAAHAQGLVHRDVKPSNILLDRTVERAMLADFGLARAVDDASITRTGIIAGTPQYMSPEQANGGSVDARSDLFGLGSVLYAMCTGRPPFRADNSYAILRLIIDKEPTPIREINPDIPEWLCEIVRRLMAKRPEIRYASAAEVAALLERCLAHVQQPTEVPPPFIDFHGTYRISKMGSFVKGGLVMLGILILGFAGMFFAQTEPPDISGDWKGPEWGAVHLNRTESGLYEGTFRDTMGSDPGTVVLKWSRIERRFNGKWDEGKGERFGEISLRLLEGKIQGAYTTDKSSRTNPETPKLADLTWVRSGVKQELPNGTRSKERSETGGNPIELEGIWEVQLPKEMLITVPENQRTRLVIVRVNGEAPSMEHASPQFWQGTYMGPIRSSASALVVDQKNHQLTFGGPENQPMHGIYEVKGDGLRLSVAPKTEPLPNRYGTDKPEFKKVYGKLAVDQVNDLRLYAEKQIAKETGDPGRAVGPDISGNWMDELVPEANFTIVSITDPLKPSIRIDTWGGTTEELIWSPSNDRYEGGGELSGGEKYRIAVKRISGEDKLSVVWTFDEAWREKWFKHKAPGYPGISPELASSLQKEYDQQNRRLWIRDKKEQKGRPEQLDPPGAAKIPHSGPVRWLEDKRPLLSGGQNPSPKSANEVPFKGVPVKEAPARTALLEFRIAANLQGGQNTPLVPADFQKRNYPNITDKGRNEAREKGFVWVKVSKQLIGDVSLPLVDFPVGESGRALLADTPEHAMVWDGKWKIESVKVVPLPGNSKDQFGIELKLNEAAGNALRCLTRAHFGQPLAIVVNNEIVAAPGIRGEVGRDVIISGVFTREQADRMAEVLKP